MNVIDNRPGDWRLSLVTRGRINIQPAYSLLLLHWENIAGFGGVHGIDRP